MKIVFFLIFIGNSLFCIGQENYLKTTTGKISFTSKAPKEVIKANTSSLTGILNLTNNNFSFKILMKNFDGFNSPLQKEHFHENYMETSDYPEATFVGKIIDQLTADKKQNVRAKGILTIHGISKEMLISINLMALDKGYFFESKFGLELEDFTISIPRLVNQKISKLIDINVSGILKKI